MWSPNGWIVRKFPWSLILEPSLHRYPYVLVLISPIFIRCQVKLHSVLQKSVMRSHQTEDKIKESDIYRAIDYEPRFARFYSKCFACVTVVNLSYNPRRDTLIMLAHFMDEQTKRNGGEAQTLRYKCQSHTSSLKPSCLPFTWEVCLEKYNWKENVFIFNFQIVYVFNLQFMKMY